MSTFEERPRTFQSNRGFAPIAARVKQLIDAPCVCLAEGTWWTNREGWEEVLSAVTAWKTAADKAIFDLTLDETVGAAEMVALAQALGLSEEAGESRASALAAISHAVLIIHEWRREKIIAYSQADCAGVGIEQSTGEGE